MKRMEWQNKKESNEHYNLESWENREIGGCAKKATHKKKGRKKKRKEREHKYARALNELR